MLESSLRGTAATAVVLDAETGRLLAAAKPLEAARLQTLPGSVLKPIFLAEALERSVLQPTTKIFCRRDLRINGRDLQCTHPQRNVAFDAADALAYSCNTYFADLGRRLAPQMLYDIAARYGLGRSPHLFATEATGEITTPRTAEGGQLFVLGLAGVTASPAQIAVAYRKLWLELNRAESQTTLLPVTLGLRESVQYGMAHNAELAGVPLLGKTGTAADPGQPRSHGWFAGIATLQGRSIVIVIYLPNANGGDAAALARHFLQAYQKGPPR